MSLIKLSKKSIFLLILPAIFIVLFGILLDIIMLTKLAITGRGSMLISAICVPLAFSTTIFAFLLIGIIHLTNLRDKYAIISLSMFVMILNVVTLIYLGEVVGGIAGEFYILLYGMGLLPALILGFVYGKIISSKMVK